MNLCAIIRAKTSFPAKCKHRFHDEVPRRERVAILLACLHLVRYHPAYVSLVFSLHCINSIHWSRAAWNYSSRIFLVATWPNFYDSTLAINSNVYELIGKLIIITYPRTDSNKFWSLVEIKTVIISPSLIFNVVNKKSYANGCRDH